MPKVKKTRRTKTTKRARRAKSPPKPALIEKLANAARFYALAGVAGVAVILAGVGAVLWAGGYFGVLAVRADRMISAWSVASGFEIKRITLKGRGQTAPDEIETALGPLLGESLLHFDADAARARIEELGWVRAVSVSRLLPDTVHISIRERKPAAVWQMSGALHLIDVNGAVIREIGAYEYSNLPLIVGAGAPGAASEILFALGRQPDLAAKTSALVRVGDRRWNMRLRNGLDVMLPDAAFDDALDTLAVLQAAHGTLDQPLEYIDLRDPERMVIRRRGEAIDD